LLRLIQAYYENGVTFLISSHQLFQQEGLGVTESFVLKDKTLVKLEMQ